jgi:WD40 repeat protein
MKSVHSVLKNAFVTTVLICAVATCRSQSNGADDEYVRAVAVNADGAVRAEVNPDGSLLVTESSPRLETQLDGLKPTRAFALAFSPSGRFLAAADTQGTIQVWDLSTHKLVRTIFQPGGVWSLAFDSQGKRLAAGGNKLVCVWNPHSGDELRKWSIKDTSVSLSFDPNGKWLAAADFNVLHVWSLDSEESLEAKAKDFSIGSVAFSPDGKVVATGGFDAGNGTVQLWKIGDTLSGTILGVLPNRVEAVAFSPDGVSIAAVSPNGIVKLWSASNGRELETLSTDDFIATLTFSGGGRTLVAVTGPNQNEKSALLSWDLQTDRNNSR